MATIRGIELASEIYDLEDTQGRTATQNAQNTANNASDKADSNETAIEAIEAVIPSTAASDNKLTTEQDLLGLCGIVITNHTIPSGFQINQKSASHPNCSWSDDVSPSKPSTNAILIAVTTLSANWFPNIMPFVRGTSAFSLVTSEDYTLQSEATYNCVWAVPKA